MNRRQNSSDKMYSLSLSLILFFLFSCCFPPAFYNFLHRQRMWNVKVVTIWIKFVRHYVGCRACVANAIYLRLSNICEAALRPQRTQWITRSAFRISFHPDWQINNGFFNSQSWRVLKSWYTGGSPEKEYLHCFADGLNLRLVSSAAQTTT